MFNIFSILAWFRKTFTRVDILLILAATAIYLLTRLINLDKFPIFCDEGIYIHWAKIAWHDASWRFISLTDGKQPLQTWGTIPFLKLFPDNLLLGGRMFAVFTGFIAMSGMYTMLHYLTNKKTAILGLFIYTLVPYFIFYDRLALVDSGVNAAFIWILFLSLWLVKTERLDVALIFGLVGGIGLLAKSSVQLFIGLSALAPILFFHKRPKEAVKKMPNFYILYGIGVVISLALYNIQRLSPFMHIVAEKNTTFIMTIQEFIHTPFAYFFDNVWR
ncbi:hypothetical protein HGB07_08025, partial [Candidatus Roizmanbacteria bacterium]|nr:hypothetical protein [Candidatus Roizmanbacteria bacterium]